MTPVDQTKLVDRDGYGNCYRACIATVFDLPLEQVYDVNNPALGYDEWRAVRNQFLMKMDRIWAGSRFRLPADVAEKQGCPEWPDIDPERDTVNGYVVVAGKSPRANGDNPDLMHAVVMHWETKEIVHDPHPSRAGLLFVEEVDVFRHIPGIRRLVRDGAWDAAVDTLPGVLESIEKGDEK